jgi:hypothetical protein
MQYFKGDDTEKKFFAVLDPILTAVSAHKSDFYSNAYGSAPLADMIFESGRSPLTNAIVQSIFRLTFKEIFDAFVVAGTFESYLTVFRKIFGNDVVITFTVPGPGQLTIDIDATTTELSPFVARKIVDNAYVFENVVDHLSNRIVFQTIKGFQSQYELEKMLFELVPGGIFTTISLSLGV